MDFSSAKRIVLPESDYYMGLLKMKGDMAQQTYSGEQLLSKDGMATPSSDTSFWNSFATSKITQEIKTKGWARITVGGEAGSGFGNMFVSQSALGLTPGAKYTVIFELANITGSGPASSLNAFDISQVTSNDPWDRDTVQLVTGCLWRGTSNVYIPITPDVDNTVAVFTANAKDTLPTIGLRAFARPNVAVGTAFDVRATILAGDHSSDWQNYIGDNWQPYVGGIPAPNPDYPQPIRTATGVQTVTVNGVDYDVNLGDIELCKIGDYQDRIYYENGKWWLRKEIGRTIIDGDYPWTSSVRHSNGNIRDIRADTNPIGYVSLGISSALAYIAELSGYSAAELPSPGASPNEGFWFNQAAYLRIALDRSRLSSDDFAGLVAWLSEHPLAMYYAVAVPTVTEITESSLLSGLNALLALGRFPKNTPPTITVDSVSPNLPAVVLTDDLLNDVKKLEASGLTLWEKDDD